VWYKGWLVEGKHVILCILLSNEGISLQISVTDSVLNQLISSAVCCTCCRRGWNRFRQLETLSCLWREGVQRFCVACWIQYTL